MLKIFNITHLEHCLIASIPTMAAALFFGKIACLIVGAYVSGIFFGREYAQAEKRGEANNGMPWEILRWSRWNTDSLIDFIAPTLCVLAVYAVAVRLGGA